MAVWGKLKNSPLRNPIYYILKRRALNHDYHLHGTALTRPANQFRPREDKDSFSFFIFRFYFMYLCLFSLYIKYFYCRILMYLLLFFYNFLNFFMFRDVPECSGMFRNVPCSWFYRRLLVSPTISVPKDKWRYARKTEMHDIIFSIFEAFLISSAGSLLASKKSKIIYYGKKVQLSADHQAGWPLCKLWEHRFSVPDLVSFPPEYNKHFLH